MGLLQFLGEAEGEFDAGDEAGEFVFTAEGADGAEDGVHFFYGFAVHGLVEGSVGGFDLGGVHVVAFVVDLVEEGENGIVGPRLGCSDMTRSVRDLMYSSIIGRLPPRGRFLRRCGGWRSWR